MNFFYLHEGTIISENLVFDNVIKKHSSNATLHFIALKTGETLSKTFFLNNH
jgi:hypothetical protein